jgi:hypothetical protein
MLRKKSPGKVRTLNGKPFETDVIADADYEHALARQEIVLLAEGEARKVLGQLRVRIERGAAETSARYYFDARLGIVRTRKKEPGRAGPEPEEERQVGS